jgi:hypothetical protein
MVGEVHGFLYYSDSLSLSLLHVYLCFVLFIFSPSKKCGWLLRFMVKKGESLQLIVLGGA